MLPLQQTTFDAGNNKTTEQRDLIKLNMSLDPEKLEKPLSKLRKLLNKFPKRPTPEQVHDLRTSTRRVEATLHALLLDRKRKGQQVLKAVKPVRKRAGKVRDMDVLTGFASTLSRGSESECLVQLLEHLGHRRFQDSRKLHRAAAKQGSVARGSLKLCSSWIKGNFNDKLGQNEWPLDAAAMALQLSGELTRWPKLTAQNLHPFRLKVKELRYVLQLSGKKDDLVEMLGEVKDKIGEWHDWTELAGIAEDVIQHPGRCDVLEQIRSGAKLRFDEAMAVANRLRRQYFEKLPASKSRAANAIQSKQPVLEAAAKLAA